MRIRRSRVSRAPAYPAMYPCHVSRTAATYRIPRIRVSRVSAYPRIPRIPATYPVLPPRIPPRIPLRRSCQAAQDGEEISPPSLRCRTARSCWQLRCPPTQARAAAGDGKG